MDRPWDQRPREGARAYEAFTTYRDLGPDRSLRRVARTLGKSFTVVSRWSARHEWVERVRAWDMEADRRRQQATLDEVEQMARRHAQAAQLSLQMLTLPAQVLADRVRADRASVLDDLATYEQRDPDTGAVVRHRRDAAAMLDLVRESSRGLAQLAQMERLARGLPADRTEISGPGGGPVATVTVPDDPDRLAAVLDILRTAHPILRAGATGDPQTEPDAPDDGVHPARSDP